MEKWKACIRAFWTAVKQAWHRFVQALRQAWTTFVAALRKLAQALLEDIRAVGAIVVQLWHKWLG